MKALTCEMCGSTNIVKQDGMYECQQCETKYSVEEAKKMMVEGTVEVKGTVQIDSSKELDNLYQIARRARDSENSENATKYYDMILVKDPNSWEANFYTVYYKSMSCKLGQIYSAAMSIVNCEEPVLNLVKDNVKDEEDKNNILNEIYFRVNKIATLLYSAASNHYWDIDLQIRERYMQEFVDNAFAARNIMFNLGDMILSIFGDEKYGNLIANCWKDGIKIYSLIINYLQDKQANVEELNRVVENVKKYDPAYTPPKIETSGGCYVATSVYGSYDCPEVWTLRRYRDFTLAETLYGRAFVKIYYVISPTLVKWLGEKTWFKKMWRERLNRFVIKLNSIGVKNTPYQDRDW